MIRLHRSTTWALLASASLIGLATPAHAQSETDKTANTGDLEEIVVTAQRRGENLQKTPLAISAVSAEKLDLQQLTEVKDLSAIAPNVSILGGTTNATAAVVSIRGIPSPADESQGFDSPIGLYVDGVYLARSSAASFEVADIERVEVLRGPQGTLFGRNTTGGAINFITALPSDEASAKVRLGVGNYGQKLGRVIFNTGDIDGLRMSVGLLRRQRNGIVDNLLEPKDSRDPGSAKITGVRWAATLDATDNLKFTNILDYTKVVGVMNASQLIGVGTGAVRPPIVIDGHTFDATQAANVAAFLAQSTTEAGCSLTPSPEYRDTICLEAAKPTTDRIIGNMFRAQLDLDAVTLRSTSSWRRWRNRIEGSDLDGLGTIINGPMLTPASTFNGMPTSLLQYIPDIPASIAPFIAASPVPRSNFSLFQADNTRRQNQFSQEFELISNGDGPLQWVLGAFYFKEKGYELNNQTFVFVVDTNASVFNADNFGPLAAAFQAANPMRYRGAPVNTTLGYNARGESKALYGQATYRPGGKDGALGMTLGLRYTWDKKDFQVFQNGATPYNATTLAQYATKSKKFSAPTGHFTVDYRANEDVNLYARVARGYRSGGFNARQAISAALPLQPFNEETIWSYEAGAKMQFANRFRLNLTGFYNVYTDQLVTIPVKITGTSSFGTVVINAGKTNYYGVEAEAQAKLNDIFSIDGTVGYVKANTKKFPYYDNGVPPVERDISSVMYPGYAPKWTANAGVTAVIPMGDTAKATARLGYNYTSSFIMYPNPITSPFGDLTKGDARGLFDGQLKFDGIGGDLGLSLTIWGKNLTNKHYLTRTVDFGQLGFANGIFGDPRTFGATLDFEF